MKSVTAATLINVLQLGHFQIPAATYVLFTMKEGGGGLTLLQRMGIGMVLAIACALVSGVVEVERKHMTRASPTLGVTPQGGEVSTMSSMWLIPQLMLAGLAEAFGYIAQIEFYYKQFPENMSSIAQSFFFVAYALSNYLSGFLVYVVHKVSEGNEGGDWLADDLNKGKLDWFYFVIGGLGVVNFVYFLVCARWYTYKGDLKRLGGEIDLEGNV
ncbi:unnamed protein product [Linum tenue]|uniref:Uncharacterized protein n=1 Tax=Linum tenue TaxID=586396 RepID=A0AAV0N4J1_9ROSI|nr:unnamed protein product [Linum tenue]